VAIPPIKKGKRMLPYYCNKVYYLILRQIERQPNIRGRYISSNTKDHSIVYRHIKKLQNDGLIYVKKGKCCITNKGSMCLDLATRYFIEKESFELKCDRIEKQYELLLELFRGDKPNSSHE
jgi:predicted transcriptional regulator